MASTDNFSKDLEGDYLDFHLIDGSHVSGMLSRVGPSDCLVNVGPKLLDNVIIMKSAIISITIEKYKD